MENYTDEEATKIFDAYKALFPKLDNMLLEYWDLKDNKERDWSCLTTDFHKVGLDKIKEFHKVVQDILNGAGEKIDRERLGIRLRDVSREYGVGYSLGISPWTDYILSETIERSNERVVIILGHDWYPIVPEKGKLEDAIRPPLSKFPIWGKYMNAIPQSITNGNYILLFLNLYPDFRPPFGRKTGRIQGADYHKFTDGFEAVCSMITKKSKYEISGIISWGAHTWEALKSRTGERLSKLTEAIRYQHSSKKGSPFDLNLGGQEFAYFPFPHPSDMRNFKCFKDIYKNPVPKSLKLSK